MQKTFAYILAFILLLPNLSAESLQAGGYYKSFFTVLNSTSLTESVTQQKSFMVSNQVRLNISYEVTDLHRLVHPTIFLRVGRKGLSSRKTVLMLELILLPTVWLI